VEGIKHEVVEGDCWRCTSHCLGGAGYVNLTRGGKRVGGHRYVYENTYGPIQAETIRHTCDNRWCINPEHLIEGSHNDNVQDRVRRNRSAIGVNNGRSKLSESDVIEIFKDQITSHTNLAKKFNVNSKVIRNIKNKISWKHLTKDL
jgi:hypothetical protein